MFHFSEYELLDFGAGRKLERFSSVVLDRPAPAAEGEEVRSPPLWRSIHARLDMANSPHGAPVRGNWVVDRDLPQAWSVSHGNLRFEMKLTEFGHIGIFPEQATNWDWIATHCERLCNPHVLNLFAYTGGSTLAAAGAGAAVTHVDAARNTVGWARRNAKLSGLGNAPVRWIVDDAVKFARREVRRKKIYDGIILDPPSYGHGLAGEAWKLDEHLPELLSICRELIEARPRFVLLSCHSPEFDPARLARLFISAGLARSASEVERGGLWIATTDKRRLQAGSFARVGV